MVLTAPNRTVKPSSFRCLPPDTHCVHATFQVLAAQYPLTAITLNTLCSHVAFNSNSDRLHCHVGILPFGARRPGCFHAELFFRIGVDPGLIHWWFQKRKRCRQTPRSGVCTLHLRASPVRGVMKMKPYRKSGVACKSGHVRPDALDELLGRRHRCGLLPLASCRLSHRLLCNACTIASTHGSIV